MSSSLPEGLSVRRVTVADAPAINELVAAAEVAVQGWSESSEPELLGWWRMMDLEDSSWVLHEEGKIAAYGVGFAHGDALELDGFVHPEQQGQGSERGSSPVLRSGHTSSGCRSCMRSPWQATSARTGCSSSSTCTSCGATTAC